MGKILVVDDEVELKDVLVEMLLVRSYEVRGCTNGCEALEILRAERFDLLISDLMMPEIGGLALIKAAVEIDPHLLTIIMTGQGTIQSAKDAIGLGAFDYLLKPFSMRTMHNLVNRALESRDLEKNPANKAVQV
jgi:DNA-binding NtrC family response regulator